jgi:hypothetical protein
MKIYQISTKYSTGMKKYQMATKYTKWPPNIPTSSVARLSKVYPNSDFWFENKPSGNAGSQLLVGLPGMI